MDGQLNPAIHVAIRHLRALDVCRLPCNAVTQIAYGAPLYSAERQLNAPQHHRAVVHGDAAHNWALDGCDCVVYAALYSQCAQPIWL